MQKQTQQQQYIHQFVVEGHRRGVHGQGVHVMIIMKIKMTRSLIKLLTMVNGSQPTLITRNNVKLHQKLRPNHRHIDFHGNNICGNKSVASVFSWPKIKDVNQESKSPKSDFMNARQRPAPKEGFLKNFMARQRLGDTYSHFKDATTCPSVPVIDEILDVLGPLLDESSFQVNGDHKKIRSTLIQIKTSIWERYQHPTEKDLADGTKKVFEEFINDPSISMIQTQTNNLNALKKHHGEYINSVFDMNNNLEYGRSKFINITNTEDDVKGVLVHPAHYLLFSPAVSLKVRLALAQDYCFHLDMMLANGYLTLEEVERIRKTIQAYLMNLTFEDVTIATNDELGNFEPTAKTTMDQVMMSVTTT